MWGQIPALCAEKVVAQTSKNRVRAKNLMGNHHHPGKRAHMRENTRILSPRMGFEARLPSDARSAHRQSFCMKNRGKVHVSEHSSSMAHCNRRGAAPADCGENGLVGCAGELPTFCRPARPLARPVSRAAVIGATLPLRRRSAGETRGQTPSLPHQPSPVRAAPGLSRAQPCSLRPSAAARRPRRVPHCFAPGWLTAQSDRGHVAPLTRSGYRENRAQ